MDLNFINKNEEKKPTVKIETAQHFSKTALVIDDSKMNHAFLKNFLEPMGYKTYFSDNGEDGLKQFDFVKPSITFLDIVMPKKSGLKVLKEIKLRDPQAIVIMVSSFTTKENIHEAKRSGADGFIKKPLSIEKIRGMVMRLENKITHA